jgi:hypothetical protein
MLKICPIASSNFCYTVITLLVLCGSDTCEDEEGSRCKSCATPVAVIGNEAQATKQCLTVVCTETTTAVVLRKAKLEATGAIRAGKAFAPHLTLKPEDLPKSSFVIAHAKGQCRGSRLVSVFRRERLELSSLFRRQSSAVSVAKR